MRHPTITHPSAVQLQYSAQFGPIIRADGHTHPTTLDYIEQAFGSEVLEQVMCSPGRFIDVALDPSVTLTANVRGRDYSLALVSPARANGGHIVDVDERSICVSLTQGIVALVEALNRAAEQEPRPVPPAVSRCRCWRDRTGQRATIIVPGVGKLTLSIYQAIGSDGDAKLKAIFSKIAAAELEAAHWHSQTPPTFKAFVELSEAEIQLVKSHQPKQAA